MNRTKVLLITLFTAMILVIAIFGYLFEKEIMAFIYGKEDVRIEVEPQVENNLLPPDEGYQAIRADDTPEDAQLIPYATPPAAPSGY